MPYRYARAKLVLFAEQGGAAKYSVFTATTNEFVTYRETYNMF